MSIFYIILIACVGELVIVSLIAFLLSRKFRVSRYEYKVLCLNNEALNNQVEVLKCENDDLKRHKDALMSELQASRYRIAKLEAEKQGLEFHLDLCKTEFAKIEEKSLRNFENLANRIFDEKTNKFNKESQENLSGLLNPLKENLQAFQKKMDESFSNHNKEQFLLKNEIHRIVMANEKITIQAENLTRALKGDVKIQGNWGEVILEKILEDSGLRKGHDYILQGSGMNLRGAEHGEIKKPDAIVNLPEGKHIIIDSKVSLTYYERYCSEKDDIIRASYLKQFISSIKSHVNILEEKKYQDVEKLGAPDFVLMFIPIEGAYSLAIQTDLTIHSYAWNKKIVIVCPSTLFATLRTIESVWRLERQNNNTAEIARQGGYLYDKVALFVADMQKLGRQMQIADITYKDAMKKLSEGHGNILRRTENLKYLGVKTSKQLPLELLKDADEELQLPQS